MSEPSQASGHVELEELASLGEGLLEPVRAEAITRHLAGCTRCTGAQARLHQVAAQLRALPPEQMPAPVRQRLEAALAAAPVDQLAAVRSRRRWRSPTLAGIAAGVAVAGLAAAVVTGGFGSGSSHSGSSSDTTAGVTRPSVLPATYPITSTGRAYSTRNLARLATSLVPASADATGAGAAGAATSGGGSATGGVRRGTAAAPLASPPSPSPAPIDPALVRLYGSAAARASCIAGLTAGGPPEVPLAVDFGRFNGTPAMIVLLPGLKPGGVDAWAVRPTCSRADVGLLDYTQLRQSP